MSQKTIRVCDRCGQDITSGVPYLRVTLHEHHTRTVELCLRGKRRSKGCANIVREAIEPTKTFL